MLKMQRDPSTVGRVEEGLNDPRRIVQAHHPQRSAAGGDKAVRGLGFDDHDVVDAGVVGSGEGPEGNGAGLDDPDLGVGMDLQPDAPARIDIYRKEG